MSATGYIAMSDAACLGQCQQQQYPRWHGYGPYAASPINIYGRINNGNVRPGSYTDNVLVNVLY
jgi:spore coat protein U-like protein